METSGFIAGILNKYTLVLIDIDNGKIVCSFTLPSDIRDIEESESKVLVSCNDGFLYLFELIC